MTGMFRAAVNWPIRGSVTPLRARLFALLGLLPFGTTAHEAPEPASGMRAPGNALGVGQLEPNPRATILAPPQMPPARLEVIGQAPGAKTRATMAASPGTAAGRARNTPQLLELPLRMALGAAEVTPGVGSRDDAPDTSSPGLARDDSRAGVHARASDWITRAGIGIALADAALIPGVTLNPAQPPSEPAILAALEARHRPAPGGEDSAARSEDAGVGANTAGAAGSMRLGPVSSIDLVVSGTTGAVQVDLANASPATSIARLTLAEGSRLQLTAERGATLEVGNLLVGGTAGGPGGALVLQAGSGGSIALQGGGSDGTGRDTVASVAAASVIQSGAPHSAAIGLNGTRGVTLEVAQNGSARHAVRVDNLANSAIILVRQSGDIPQTVSGVILRAGPDSRLSLKQR